MLVFIDDGLSFTLAGLFKNKYQLNFKHCSDYSTANYFTSRPNYDLLSPTNPLMLVRN